MYEYLYINVLYLHTMNIRIKQSHIQTCARALTGPPLREMRANTHTRKYNIERKRARGRDIQRIETHMLRTRERERKREKRERNTQSDRVKEVG